MVFSGSKYCTLQINSYTGLFEHTRGSETVTIKDPMITSSVVAQERAKAELIKGGYSERWISIITIFTPNLKQNDIISYKGENWIVKEISLTFTTPTLMQSIKGVRYE